MPRLRSWLTGIGISIAALLLTAAAVGPGKAAYGAGQSAAGGSMPVHLTLKLNGKLIQGDSPSSSLGRDNTIACYQFEQAVTTARETGSGMATGRRQYEPIMCVKRIDKSSPLLMKALTENQVAEGVFKFYRPSPTGDGTEEQFYTIQIKNARITSIRLVSDGSGAPYEEVQFNFQSISWTYTNGGITEEDSWSGGK